MQVPFNEQEFNEFTNILCEKHKSYCDDCPVNEECMSYHLFEQGFAHDDKKIIQKGLQFAQKINSIRFTIYKINKIPLYTSKTLIETQKIIDTYNIIENLDKDYTIELTES